MQKKTKIILLFIVSLGFFLRLHHLSKESLSIDEVITSLKFLYPIPDLVKYWFSAGHFPSYFLIMHYWLKIFGTGEFALRFPTVIFGAMSIYLMFLLGKRLFNENIGLLASYLFAVSTINIFYSQWAKIYSMAVFFVLMSFLFLFDALERNTKPLWLGYILFTLLALLTSASTSPIIICQLLFITLLWSRYKRYITAKQAISVVTVILAIYLPSLVILVLSITKDGHIQQFVSLHSLISFVNIFHLFGGRINQLIMAYNPTRNQALAIPTNIFGIILFLLCLVGIFSSFKSGRQENTHIAERQRASGLFLSLWLGIPIVLPFIFSHLVMPVFGPVRYVLYVSAPYYLLISKGIMSFRRKIRLPLILFIICMGCLFLQEYYRVEKRTNWRKICNYIKINIKNDEKTASLLNNFLPISFVELGMLSYYSAPSVIGIRSNEGLKNMSGEEKEIYNEQLDKIEWYKIEDLSFNGIWLVKCDLPSFPNLHSGAIKRLQNEYALVEQRRFYDVNLWHFRTKRME